MHVQRNPRVEDSVFDHLERAMRRYGETSRDIQAIRFEQGDTPQYYVPPSKQRVILPGNEARQILGSIPWDEIEDIPSFTVWSKGNVYTTEECEDFWHFVALPRSFSKAIGGRLKL